MTLLVPAQPPALPASDDMTGTRELLVDLYEAAVAGAAPGPLTSAALASFEALPGQRLWLLAFGKAALAMADASVASLQGSGGHLAGGVVIAPDVGPAPGANVTVSAGDHPLPGSRSFAAAAQIARVVHGVRAEDVAIVLPSGGASSLIAGPLPGMAGNDLTHLFDLLLASGLDVREMNAVRKRFTRWGAGRLALALAPARTHVLVISDVPGDDPADVGSGPCAPDPNTVRDVIALMRRSAVLGRIAPMMRDYLAGVARGVIPETPSRTHRAFAHVTTRVIGTNRLALDAVVARARVLGQAMAHGASPLSGSAARAGEVIAATLLDRARAGHAGGVVWGGETTVTLANAASVPDGDAASRTASPPPAFTTPAGGRCQEMALAAARVLHLAGDTGRRVTLLAAGTDGRDGPTDASGAFADAALWRAIERSGRDPGAALARHESYAALDGAGALLRHGRTGTNVMDVVIGLVR